MKPRGPLMIEHRIIEKLMKSIENRLPEIERAGAVELSFLDTVIDFMWTYTDAAHHGKEEEIYFRECARKGMEESLVALMNELIAEHDQSRKAIENLVLAREKLLAGERVAPLVLDNFRSLVDIYREHIEKEDKHFFPDSEKYLSDEDQKRMLEVFPAFDKQVFHKKYQTVAADLIHPAS